MRYRSALMEACAAFLVMVPAAAFAQDQVPSQPGDRQGPPAPPVIVKNCRNTQTGEIVVCGGQRSPYRLPPPSPRFDPDAGVNSISRERHELYEQGDSGIGSCSTVGPGGTSGCGFKAFKRSHEQNDGHGKKGIVDKILDRNEPDPLPQ